MANRNGFVRYATLITKMLSILVVISILFIIDIPLAIDTIQPIPDDIKDNDIDNTDKDISTLPNMDSSPTETPGDKEPVIVPPTQGSEDTGQDSEDKDEREEESKEPNDPIEESDDPEQEEDTNHDPDKSSDEDQEKNTDDNADGNPDDPVEDEDSQEPGDDQSEINKYDQAAMEAISQRELNKLYGRNEDKVAYLTFDDGPTKAFTHAILNILAEEDVKATFFLIGTQVEQYPELVRRQYEEGHGIGNHTYTHVFKDIYKNPASYVKELKHMEKVLQSTLDMDKKFRLTRFPGGSFGDDLAPFRKGVNQEGFVHIDWNCVNGDAESLEISRPEELVDRVKETAKDQTSLIVLMHDSLGKQTTVEALPEIISFLRQEGYRFELLPASRGY